MPENWREVAQRVRNWGKWGDSDQIGTLNYMLTLRDMGLMLGEIWALDELAADCAQDKIYEFMLVAQPLLIPGAVGSPVAPLAIK